ncbi:hypothetical protein [Pedobacter steynii]
MKRTIIMLALLLGMGVTSCKKAELKDAPESCIRITKKLEKVVQTDNQYQIEYFVEYKRDMQGSASVIKVSEAKYNNAGVDDLICGVTPDDIKNGEIK